MGEEINFLGLLQEFTAVEALGSNAIRNQGRGVLGAIQGQLAQLDLHVIPHANAEDYERWLDEKTEEIRGHLPVLPGPWGAVRKGLNLFMRACICDHYLRSAYGLEEVEPLAEIPLDNVVARALRRAAGRGVLPRMESLRRLNQADHRRYQQFAADYAQHLHLPARVYLDNLLWLRNR